MLSYNLSINCWCIVKKKICNTDVVCRWSITPTPGWQRIWIRSMTTSHRCSTTPPARLCKISGKMVRYLTLLVWVRHNSPTAGYIYIWRKYSCKYVLKIKMKQLNCKVDMLTCWINDCSDTNKAEYWIRTRSDQTLQYYLSKEYIAVTNNHCRWCSNWICIHSFWTKRL